MHNREKCTVKTFIVSLTICSLFKLIGCTEPEGFVDNIKDETFMDFDSITVPQPDLDVILSEGFNPLDKSTYGMSIALYGLKVSKISETKYYLEVGNHSYLFADNVYYHLEVGEIAHTVGAGPE